MSSENNLYFDVSSPYETAYRNSISKTPVGPHFHNAAEIYFTLTELPDVLINDTVSRVSAGSLIIIPPFCVHQLYHEANVSYERYILSVHQEWLSQILWQNPSVFPYLKSGAAALIVPLNNELSESLILCFRRTLEAPAVSTGSRNESALSNANFMPTGVSLSSTICLLDLISQIDTTVTDYLPVMHNSSLTISGAQHTVNEMISYINSHLYDNIRLNELAGHFYLNPDYMSRLFKQHTHTSIGRYITIQKITQAQVLLREGKSIAEIQELLGYSSYAHFAKVFKKTTGITPGQYKLNASSYRFSRNPESQV